MRRTSLFILSTAALAFAVYALPSGLAAQASQAPGGFVEMMTSTVARAQPTASQIAQFVPGSRGRFFFPAPYNTEAYRITIPSDCGGTDCIQQEGYSAWRNINAHAGQPVLRMFIGLQNTTYITLFTLDKATGTVTNNGPVFPSGGSDPLSYSRGGGWFWSGTDPDILYAYATSQLVAKNVVTGAQSVVLDLASSGAQAAHGQGSNVRVWAATGSDDGNSWAMAVRVGGNDAGCALYHRPTNAWHYIQGPMGDCYVDKSGTYWTAGVAGQFGLDIRSGTMNPWAVRDTLTDPMGAPGHLDHGFGFLIGEDNWAALGQTLKLWDLSQPFTAPGQGRIVHTMVQWGTDSYVQPTMGNARPATMATIGSQYACSTTTFSVAPSPPVAREREIVCFPLDGSGRMLVVAPNMTSMAASGGGIPYYRAPKGNLDTTGEYYYWITNLGGNRLEAFLVRVPWQVLMGGGSGDTTAPTVALSAPASGATVNGTVTVSATASDNVGVTGVQFRVDGVNVGSEDTTSPYSISWNTTTAANGSHALTALARDAAGNTRTSSAVNVTVQNSAPGDTTPPTIAITAPANGATVSATVNVAANASDNVGVAGVQFLLDGANLGAEDTSSPYAVSWSTTGASNGSHTLVARARDAAGNTQTSSVTVNVQNQAADTTPPTASLTAPANGATVSGTVAVSATASDNVGVAGVQFRVDGVNVGGEDTSSPYGISWNTTTLANGTHTLTAVARDAAGNTVTSASRSVTVSNSQAPAGGLLAAYGFNESGGTSVADSSPTGNAATLRGAATWATGRYGSSLSTAGASYAEAPDHDALTAGTTATFEAWVYLTSKPSEVASIANKWNESVEDEFFFGLAPDQTPIFAWHTTGGSSWGSVAYDYAGGTGVVPIGTWTHVAVVRNGTTLSFYLNGTLSSTATAMDANPFRGGTNSLRIGGQARGGPARHFPGRIDELRIYGRALTQEEIQADLNAPIGASGDTTPPSVSVTAPASGATVSGTVTVSATAADGGGVAGVQFRLDGANLGGEDTTSPYSISWNTATAANGSHTLTAIARDAAGNTATASSITVTVQNQAPGDGTPPTVALSAPASGATVSGSIAVSATASDNVGVAGVQFRVDGVNIGAEDTSSPYSITWDTATAGNGSHTLTAIARDAAGNVTTSAARTVTVSNVAPVAGLVAAYAFNENGGTTTADSSPGNNTATLTGASWATGRFGSALAANGAGYANAPDTAALTPGTAATFEAWVYLTSSPGGLVSILNKWSQSVDDEYLLGLLANRRVFFTWKTTGGSAWGTPAFNEVTSTAAVPLNQWTHIAVVRNGPTLSFYLNGALASSVAAMDNNPFRNGTNSLRVGGQNRGGVTRYFPGYIDEVRIYTRALNAVEIQTDMNTPVGAPAGLLTAAWRGIERRRYLDPFRGERLTTR